MLQYARHQATGIDGTVLERHGNRVPIDTTHEKPEETSHGQKLLESLAVDSRDLQHPQDDHVENHGIFAPESISGQTEGGGTDGAQKEGKCDSSGNVGIGLIVVFCQLDGLDGESMEIEGIGCPSPKPTQEEEPLCRSVSHFGKLSSPEAHLRLAHSAVERGRRDSGEAPDLAIRSGFRQSRWSPQPSAST